MRCIQRVALAQWLIGANTECDAQSNSGRGLLFVLEIRARDGQIN